MKYVVIQKRNPAVQQTVDEDGVVPYREHAALRNKYTIKPMAEETPPEALPEEQPAPAKKRRGRPKKS